MKAACPGCNPASELATTEIGSSTPCDPEQDWEAVNTFIYFIYFIQQNKEQFQSNLFFFFFTLNEKEQNEEQFYFVPLRKTIKSKTKQKNKNRLLIDGWKLIVSLVVIPRCGSCCASSQDF